MNKWTIKEVVINKTLPLIILTIILTLALTKLINQTFTRQVVLENGFTHTTHFFLTGPAILLLAIPVSFISVLLIQLFLNISGKKATPVEYRKEFTWYSMYSLIIGLLIFSTLSTWMSTSFASVTVDSLVGGTLWTVAVFLIPFVGAIAVAIILNRVMTRITNTNSRLILEIEQGEHEQYFKDYDTKDNVIKALRRGHTSTIPAAIWYVRSIQFLRITFAFVMKAFRVLAIIISELIPNPNSSSSSGGYSPVRNTGVDQGDSEWEKKQAKRQADYTARQDQKQADYSLKQLNKQLNYNAKYSKPEWNRYVHDQRKANESREKADRM